MDTQYPKRPTRPPTTHYIRMWADNGGSVLSRDIRTGYALLRLHASDLATDGSLSSSGMVRLPKLMRKLKGWDRIANTEWQIIDENTARAEMGVLGEDEL